MNWILFLVMSIFTFGFIFLGFGFKNFVFLIFGTIFIIILGIAVLTTGLSIPSGFLVG